MDNPTIKKLALIISANCTKNSLIEQADQSPLSEEERNKLNQLITNRIYTFLLYLLNKPAQEYATLMEELAKNYPDKWPQPELDNTFTQIVKQAIQPPSSGISVP